MILVVDDNELNRGLFCRRLERQGYTVMSRTATGAWRSAGQRVAVDLVLLDIMMPEMNGYEVLSA